MTPERCPACGRFLKSDFVDSLTDGARPCPGCDETLQAEQFEAGSSVRPPSVAPPNDPGDVLAGWDPGADDATRASWVRDRPPFPVDALAVSLAGALGAMIGWMTSSSRSRGAAFGAVVGLVAGGVARQIWRLTDR